MSADPQQLAILEQALAESPDNVTLRLHVASLHLELDAAEPGVEHPTSALAHCQGVIGAQPAHIAAPDLAVRAARAAGDAALADRYQRIAQAFGGVAPAAP